MTFSFVSWCSPDHLIHHTGLQQDCERFGYPLHTRVVDANMRTPLQAWFYKPYFIRDCLEKFERVAFMDAEARILKPLPERWLSSAFLLSRFTPPMGTEPLLQLHSAFCVLDRGQRPLIDAWIRVIERLKLAELNEVQAHRWDVSQEQPKAERQGMVTDEIAMVMAAAVLDVHPEEIRVSWRPPPYLGEEEMRLGAIANEHTFILHPFLHHWWQENFRWRPYEFYRMFRYHFTGDQERVKQVMHAGKETLEEAGWRFDAKAGVYAPLARWEHFKAEWLPERQAVWEEGF